MEHVFLGSYGPLVPFLFLGAALIPLFLLWSVFWKGLALWHAARRGQPWWFLAILVINLAGILEIVYLFFILKLTLNNLFTMDSDKAKSAVPDKPVQQ